VYLGNQACIQAIMHYVFGKKDEVCMQGMMYSAFRKKDEAGLQAILSYVLDCKKQ